VFNVPLFSNVRFSITLFTLSIGVASLVACGSGGATIGSSPVGGGTGSSGTGGSPTPTPSPSPSAAVTGAIYHPPDNGDTFAFAGTLTTTYARPSQYPTPEPTQTAFATVSQAVTVKNPATFNGTTNAVDFNDVETDVQTAPAQQTTSTTTDAYFTFSNTIVTGNFNELGFTATQDNGYTVTVTYGSGNGLVDILPETAGATWSNTPALTTSATAPDGTTSQETINADGTYTENFVYPNVGAVSDTAMAQSSLDGSGSYVTPDEGTLRGSAQSYTLTAPSAQTSSGTITETTSAEPAPEAAGAPPTVPTTAIPNWIPTGYLGTALATESDVDNGATTVPTACALPAQFGTSANQIVQTKKRLDPMFGELETETVTTYDMQTIGPVCTVINDVTTDYYDFSSQSVETKETVNFEGTPQQITTIAETIGLQAETLDSVARRPQTAARTIAARLGPRVALAESNIIASREIRHLKMMRAFALAHARPGVR
jgi:hypothetical protein